MVEALPMEVPDRIEADISGLAIGDSIRLADLKVHEGVRFVEDEETVIATVTVPTRVEEPEVEGEEGEEGEAAAEGEGEAPEAGAESEAEASGEAEESEG
jgi:large subunit ribosomal protein L25